MPEEAIATEEVKVEKPVPETVEKAEAVEEKTLLGEEAPETQEEKATDTKEAKPAVPEKYEVKVPEGMVVDEGMISALTPVFKKHSLTQEAVQELADAYAPVVKAQVEAKQKELVNSYKQTVDGWKADTQKALGANAAQELAFAAKFINKMSETPEEAKALREILDETGVGNHPLIAKIFIRGGKRISEDKFAEPNKQTTGGGNDLASIYDHPSSKATLKY